MKNKVELLAPVGNFDCLKAAIQNGADAVYLGASNFSARASATNFNYEDLKKAVEYAHIRNVKVHLALNTLIKNNELNSALELASYAYEIGIDAIIVQDLGLAQILLKNFPKMPIHASTQMTIHNLEGVLQAEKLGFSRVILSRELSFDEIDYISGGERRDWYFSMFRSWCTLYFIFWSMFIFKYDWWAFCKSW